MEPEPAWISSMWRWATSSEAHRALGRVLTAAAVVGVLAFGPGAAAPAAARVLLTVDEALGLAFPGCDVDRGTVFLTDEQVARASALSGEEVPSALVHPYRATCDGGGGGTAYFDTHRVRTLPETLMIVVGADGAVTRIEVLSFKEPPEYMPRGLWYDQFLGEALSPELALKRDIRQVTGATLTARATTAAVRRVLAIHRVIETTKPAAGAKPGEPAATGQREE